MKKTVKNDKHFNTLLNQIVKYFVDKDIRDRYLTDRLGHRGLYRPNIYKLYPLQG